MQDYHYDTIATNSSTGGNLTKYKWKKIVEEAMVKLNQSYYNEQHPMIYSIKPTAKLCEWIKAVPVEALPHLLEARQLTERKMKCKCNKTVVGTVLLHVLKECSIMEIIIGRLTLLDGLEEDAPTIKDSHIVVKAGILIGQPTNKLYNEKENADLLPLRLEMAKLLQEASRNMTDIPS
jgi:hypothetical protein